MTREECRVPAFLDNVVAASEPEAVPGLLGAIDDCVGYEIAEQLLAVSHESDYELEQTEDRQHVNSTEERSDGRRLVIDWIAVFGHDADPGNQLAYCPSIPPFEVDIVHEN